MGAVPVLASGHSHLVWKWQAVLARVALGAWRLGGVLQQQRQETVEEEEEEVPRLLGLRLLEWGQRLPLVRRLKRARNHRTRLNIYQGNDTVHFQYLLNLSVSISNGTSR